MSLSALLLCEHHKILAANKIHSPKSRKYTLVGNMPTPLDIISFQTELPLLNEGDTIAVMDTGAYFTSLGNNFAGPRPAVVMIEDGKAHLIKERETFSEMIRRDKFFTDQKSADVNL